MKPFLKLPGYKHLAAASISVLAICLWVVSSVAAGDRERRGIAYAEEGLSQAEAVALVLRGLSAGDAGELDRQAAVIAGASGGLVMFVDTAIYREPRLLGSSEPSSPELLTLARRNRMVTDPEETPRRELWAGVTHLTRTVALPTPPGEEGALLIALAPAELPGGGGGALRWAALLAFLLGAGTLLLACIWAARLTASPLRTITLATHRAAAGEGGGVTLRPDDGPIGVLGMGVQVLIQAMQEQKQELVQTKKARAEEAAASPQQPEPKVEKVDGGALEPGQLFAERYEILERLGQSAVRTAYRVRDRELDDFVTLKTLQEGLFAGDPTAVERFRSDLRVARRLAHPNILRVDDFGEWAGVYFVTMDLVEATPLRVLIQEAAEGGGLPVRQVLDIMSQVCTALHIAHGDGVLHRDVRPESILIESQGRAKLADFGLASPAHRTRAAAAGMDPHTQGYVAPEVLRADPVDERGDLYAVGVSLFESLSGRLPYEDAIRRGVTPPNLAELNPEVPPPLADLVSRLLSSMPDDRPGSAAEVKASLAQIAAGVA